MRVASIHGKMAARGIVFAGAMAVLAVPGLAQRAASEGAAATEKRSRFNFFISGHSLTDPPLPQYLAGIALSQGHATRWNQQSVVGSPLSWRTWGGKGNWQGYREGTNANGRKNMDVIKELRERRGADAYDALIVAEGHNTAAVLRHHDTVRYLRHIHERLIAGNPQGVTYLYEPWESIKDRSDPKPWIRLERAAAKLWGCVVERVNMSLRHENRPDRVKGLPIGAGLTFLVERATEQSVAGISGASPEETWRRIFLDDVHLAPLGMYYAAILTYIGTTGEPLRNAWHPNTVTPEQAKTLQQLAEEFYRARAAEPAPSLPACRQLMVESFCDDWNAYVPSKWVGPVRDCQQYFSRATSAPGQYKVQSPFVFDPATDAAYWLPAPAE